MLTIGIKPHIRNIYVNHVFRSSFQEGYNVVIDRQTDSGSSLKLAKGVDRDTAEKLAGALGELINAEIATQVNDTANFIREHMAGHGDSQSRFSLIEALKHAAEQTVKVRIVDSEKEEQRKAAESAKLAEEREAKLRKVWAQEAHEYTKAFEANTGFVFSVNELDNLTASYITRKQKQRSEAQKVAENLVKQ